MFSRTVRITRKALRINSSCSAVQAAITERATAVIFVFTQYKDKPEDDLFLYIIHT